MKTQYLNKPINAILLCLFAFFYTNNLQAQCTGDVYIPDANFKIVLINNAAINTNNDAEIQCSEAAAYTGVLNVANNNIASLTGIQAFTSITELNCSNNLLQFLYLNLNAALIKIDCSGNRLIDLDVTENLALSELVCFSNL